MVLISSTSEVCAILYNHVNRKDSETTRLTLYIPLSHIVVTDIYCTCQVFSDQHLVITQPLTFVTFFMSSTLTAPLRSKSPASRCRRMYLVGGLKNFFLPSSLSHSCLIKGVLMSDVHNGMGEV